MFFLFCGVVCAKIRGKVQSAEGKPIASASVVLYKEDDTILAYTRSKEKGDFAFDVPDAEAKYVVVRCLGYSPKRSAIGKDGYVEVILASSDVRLEEVVIKAKPIREANDTTSYSVSGFSDGTERNIEEVIKKMPGISVSESGTISFRGKAISKILLDNVDMFGDNYKVASKTIPPQFIGTVEAIKHYQENRLLKDAKTSDDVVLNLSVKSGLNLQKPVGQISAGGGLTDRYDLGGNILTMNKTVKLYGTAGLSNVASSDLLFSEGYEQLLPSEIVSDYSYSFADRDNIRYFDRTSKHASLDLVLQPGKKWLIKNRLSAEYNKNNNSNHEVIRYVDEDKLIDHQVLLQNRPLRFTNNLEMEFHWNNSTLLKYSNRLYYNNKHTDNAFLEASRQDYLTRVWQVAQKNTLNVTHAFADKSALVFDASYALGDSRQRFNYDGWTNQHLRSDNDVAGISLGYLKKKNKWELVFKLGMDYTHTQHDLSNQLLSPQSADYKHQMYYGQTSAKWTGKFLHLELGTKFGYSIQQMKTPALGDYHIHQFRVIPNVNMGFTAGKHNLTVSTSYEQKDLQPLNYLSYYTDYRQYQNASTFANAERADFDISATYTFHPSLSTLLLCMYSHNVARDEFVSAYDLTDSLDRTTPSTLRDNNSDLALMAFSLYSDALRHGLRLTVDYNSSSYMDAVNEQDIREITTSSLSTKLSLRSAFSGPINYVIGGRYMASYYRSDAFGKIPNRDYSVFQELSGKWGCLNMKCAIDEHFLGKDHHLYLFLSPQIRYDWKKYNIAIDFRAYNVLNRKSINEYTVNDIYTREYVQRIVPSLYLLSLSYTY